MKHELHLAQDLGSYLAEGALAAEYRLRRIEPCLGVYEVIVLDFESVRGVNSSFANALLVPLLSEHGAEVLSKLRFRHCSPVVKVMLESALAMGMQAARSGDVRA
jgi:hypothetical protein